MAGEVYAFASGFDCAFMIKHELESIYKERIPMNLLTDMKRMFDVVTKATHTTRKKLMIDLATAREAYGRGEISNVGLLLSENNIAHGLITAIYCEAMDRMLRSGYDRTLVLQ